MAATNVQHSQNGWTALVYAAEKGHAECVQCLVDGGANKDAIDNVRIVYLFPGSNCEI